MSKRMTIAELEQLAAAGKIRGYQVNKPREVLPIINLKGKRKAKYGNRKVVVDDIEFDSEKEAARYSELKTQLKAGIIGILELQVPYRFNIEGKKVSTYMADFRYINADTGEIVVEDVKSEITRKLPVYRLKKKLMRQVYGIDIVEV